MVTAPDRQTPAARLVYVNVGGPGQLPHWAADRDVRGSSECHSQPLTGLPGISHIWRLWRSTMGEGDGWGEVRRACWDSLPPNHLWMVHLLLHTSFEPQMTPWREKEGGKGSAFNVCVFEHFHTDSFSIQSYFNRVRYWQLQLKLAMHCRFCIYFLCTCCVIHNNCRTDVPNNLQETSRECGVKLLFPFNSKNKYENYLFLNIILFCNIISCWAVTINQQIFRFK